jgi:hypothetical protein
VLKGPSEGRSLTDIYESIAICVKHLQTMKNTWSNQIAQLSKETGKQREASFTSVKGE